jgi:hypothetical protein
MMTLTIKKSTIYWVTVFALQFLFIAWYKGIIGFDSGIIPMPPPRPIGVIQLDKTEYGLYQYAIANVQGETDAEKRNSLTFLLGMISVKQAIVDAYPNEKVELLP